MSTEIGPLSARVIVVTRPRTQSAAFVKALRRLGAEVITVPTIRITAPADPQPLRDAVRTIDRFDWIVFTSVNGVERFWKALEAEGQDSGSVASTSLCAIGAATARAIERRGARLALVPDEFVAESLVEAFRDSGGMAGKRVLMPRAETSRPVLTEALRSMGAEVIEVPAYRTVPAAPVTGSLQRRLQEGSVDFVTFTSSSSVRNFAKLVSGDLGRARLASIGPITSDTARELGWEVDIEATVHSTEGLCSALVEYVKRTGKGDE